MRWTQWPRWTSEGLLRTAKSCGPGTPTLVSSFAEVFREATVAKEPGHRGEHEVTVKTNAQGMSGCFGVPVVTTLVRFFCCVRGCGCIVHPAFPAPAIFLGRMDRTQLGRQPRREVAQARRRGAAVHLHHRG